MADPVASKSGFLRMYMSNHPDTLVSYVRYFGHIHDTVVTAEMTAIDTKGMTLSYKTKGAGDVKREVRVPFDPPLAGYEEVKPRLLSMKVDAEEALGMSKAPQIFTFHLPFDIWQTTLMLGTLAYVALAPSPSSPSFHPAFELAYWIRGYVPPWFITATVWFALVVHVSEALYTTVLVRRHKVPFVIAVQWVLSDLVWGYPILFELRRRIQEAKIESIMKGQ